MLIDNTELVISRKNLPESAIDEVRTPKLIIAIRKLFKKVDTYGSTLTDLRLFDITLKSNR